MQKLFAIYDSKVAAYERPWLAPNKGAALRAVLDVFKDPNHPFTKWPADFTLFEIADWDEQTGTIVPHATKTNCGVLIELIPMASDNTTSPRDVVPLRNTEISNKENNRETRQ